MAIPNQHRPSRRQIRPRFLDCLRRIEESALGGATDPREILGRLECVPRSGRLDDATLAGSRERHVARPSPAERDDDPLGRRDVEEPLDIERRAVGRDRTVGVRLRDIEGGLDDGPPVRVGVGQWLESPAAGPEGIRFRLQANLVLPKRR